ncbi:MAG: aldose 1-epimerase [Bacteroidetes bacterium]|nr:MAG: aldose 1-epimerase [Bacteroidota bacterium]
MFLIERDNDAVTIHGNAIKLVVWPNCGAILNQWSVQLQHGTEEIIEGYADVQDFTHNAETKGFRSCKLSPYVCRMAPNGYKFEGTNYQIGKYILGQTPIHGLLYNLPFEVVAQTCNANMASVSLLHHYSGEDAGFPFSYNIEVTYILEANNRLSIKTKVENTGAVPMPISDGWHPYFKLGARVDALQIAIDAEAMVEFDEALLPTGKLLPNLFHTDTSLEQTELDNCFLLNNPLNGPACTLSNPDKGLRLRIFAHENYPYLQVYTPPHRQSIAIENLSSAPNAFNNGMGLMVLDPQASSSFEATYLLEVE